MCCELLSNFLYFCSRNNFLTNNRTAAFVVNCSQIFCTFAVETTQQCAGTVAAWLWIALKFFVLLQSKQLLRPPWSIDTSCELLSNFLYFCSRNNTFGCDPATLAVVNCSQIFCTFAAETTVIYKRYRFETLWIALKFFVLLQPKQPIIHELRRVIGCELLSNFLYFCSRNNREPTNWFLAMVVNCSQIFCTFAAETTPSDVGFLCLSLWIALKFFVLLQPKQRFDIGNWQ